MRQDGYHEMCQWVNAHQHGSMKDFDAGLQIVDAYINDQYERMKLLRNGDRLYDLLMDRIDLLELIRNKPAVSVASINTSVQQPVIEQSSHNFKKAVSVANPISHKPVSAISVLEHDNKLAMKEQAALHGQLFKIGRDRNDKSIPLSDAMKAKRAPIADKIVQLEHQIRKNWHDIDHLKIYGKLPNEAPSAAIDDYKKKDNNQKMIRALRMSIPKLEQKIATLSGAKLDKALRTLEQQKINYRNRTGTEWQGKK